MKKVLIALAVAGAMVAPVVVQAEDGKALYDARCQSCHGVEGNVPMTPEYPKLKGQNEAYLIKALNAYKSGERTGGNAPIMVGMANTVNDEQSKAIATYLSGL